ncbi:tol-pal system protein YbgF [Thiorhodococcus mannitoliphagus]|uniref:Cell division coordinator CpoB n=1 Tax=Thiorhodococcus mannitoliphagus TaxID=329406 RepID=A0A6P1DSA1_9GAMM|nr:tol-pal system protein YbgF [Thiorhodococcus mannitoliphagus]NEX19576.1 tol-pal system protein YbgF [Thiorhodococcus mannitoliphagus]
MKFFAPQVALIVTGLTTALWLEVASAADPALEGRIGRLERILENQTGSELLLQVQRLQTEMQELRGMVEQQRFDVEKLQRQQRDQFIDLDSRLSGSATGGQPARLGGSAAIGEAKPTLPPGMVDASAGGFGAAGTVSQPQAPEAPQSPLSPNPTGIPALPSPETIGGSERDLYSHGFELLKDRKYEESKVAFNELLRRYPQGEFTDNARYWLGETYYVMRDYPAALAEYDRLVQLNPSSPKVPGAMLKVGFIQYEQKDYDQAKSTLEQVVRNYPNSTEARLARSRLERIGNAGAAAAQRP